MSNGYIVNTMGDGTNVDFLLDQQNSYLLQQNTLLIEENARLSEYIAEVKVEITKLLNYWRENIEAKTKLEKQYTKLKKMFTTQIEKNQSLQSDVNILEHINKNLEEALTKANAKLTLLTKANAELKSLNNKRVGRAKGNG
jgi:hypothetical protein